MENTKELKSKHDMNLWKKNYPTIIVSLIIYMILFTLVLLFPYSGDDWTWGSDYGIQALKEGYKNLNGRYLGNLLITLITHVKLFAYIILPICYFLCVYFVYKFSVSNKRRYIILLFPFCYF